MLQKGDWNMNKYELIAKVTVCVTVVTTVFMAGHFGLNVSFDKKKFE
jgi:hypothetical protein